MSNEQVTSLAQLKEYGRGTFVQLPDFAEGQPFYARLKRPSMMALGKKGKIPNDLLTTANKLFTCQAADEEMVQKDNMMGEMLDTIECLAEASFVEPTWAEIKEAGVELTDEQLMFVFSYTQDGVKALDSFRGQQEDHDGAEASGEILQITE